MSIKAKLNMRVTIDPILTQHDWQLYTPRTATEIEATRKAVSAINAALKEAINHKPDSVGVPALTRDQAYQLVTDVMMKHRNTGAMDTEPRGVLEDCLDLIYHTDLSL